MNCPLCAPRYVRLPMPLDAVEKNRIGTILCWHETCKTFILSASDSQSQKESVRFESCSAKSSVHGIDSSQEQEQEQENEQAIAMAPRAGSRLLTRCLIGDGDDAAMIGWIHGAARNAHRKRTCVRVACGGVQRSHGEGNYSSHGPLGRFLVSRDSFPSVVLLPACKGLPCQRHFPRSSRLLAALTPLQLSVGRLSISITMASRATRPVGQPAIGAIFRKQSTGMSAGWKRCTPPKPTPASAFG